MYSVLDLGDGERLLIPPDGVSGANWGIRRGVLDAAGGFDSALGFGPCAFMEGDEVSVGFRIHGQGLGISVYSPGAAIGRLVQADQLDERYLVYKAVRVGTERLRHAQGVGELARDQIVTRAEAAARELLTVVSLDGDLSVAAVAKVIAGGRAELSLRVSGAVALGELAASALLLGEEEVLAGNLRLRIDGDSLMRGRIEAPASLSV